MGYRMVSGQPGIKGDKRKFEEKEGGKREKKGGKREMSQTHKTMIRAI